MQKIRITCCLAMLAMYVLAGCGTNSQSSAPSSMHTSLPPTYTHTLTPTFTPAHTPTLTLTVTVTPTITLTPGIGSVLTNPVDGAKLSYVPAGEFEMGDEPQEDYDICAQFYFPGCEESSFETGNPVHVVYLDGFWMYHTEVTNDQYALFLNELGNQIEDGRAWLTDWSEYVRIHKTDNNWQVDSGYGDYPVVDVTWYGAAAYCEWAGGRLPTEAEWEKAARGGLEGKLYPWGDVLGDNTANFCDQNCEYRHAIMNLDDGYVSEAPVGSYPPNGFGLYDMAGNVWEWVADWHDYEYYQNSSDVNPTGPKSGIQRVLRGGTYGSIKEYLRVATRSRGFPDISRLSYGFRCVLPSFP